MKYIIPIIILLILPFKSSSPSFCVCPKLENKYTEKIKENSDVIVIGKFTNPIPFGKYDEGVNMNGYFKIDSIIKGPTGLKNLVINQFSTGNCRELFQLNKEYLVFGIHITEFKNMPVSNKSKDENLPPPPLNEIHDSIMDCYSSDKRTIKKWNGIAEKNYVIFTDQCSTFGSKGQFAKKFME